MSGAGSLGLFQKNLQDVVKGIRNNHKRGDPNAFISEAFSEIKIELKSTDPFVKAEAIRKLTYLQSIGYNVSWASFAIIEVMSQSRFEHKKIGYLAANQSFNENTDLILLTTNLFKKEFVNHLNSYYCIGLALNCLGNIATKDLSRDCISDVMQLMNHPKPYIRKKAIITMYKIYIQYPQGFRLTFDKLKEKLDDEDNSVVSCAVNVICELANKNPRNYLAMAPKFFKLLTTSSNNWMLIKVVKLLGSLVPEEPRLARKLLEPLATIIQNTSAKSLQFECIYTVTLSLPFTKREDGTDAKNVPAVLNLCLHHLRILVQDEDPNLKYLGLVGLLSLLHSHPRVVLEQRQLILGCLEDEDITIRFKALELLVGIVTKKTLIDLVQQLLKHLTFAEGRYRDDIIDKILQMGSRGRYSLVTDFLWYVSVLQRLACVPNSGYNSEPTASLNHSIAVSHSKHGKEVSDQLMEIALRVQNSRPFVVECMISLLMNSQLLLQGQARDTVGEAFMAASWIVGEYSYVLLDIMLDNNVDSASEEDSDADSNGYWIDGPDGTELRSRWRKLPLHLLLIETLLHARIIALPPRVQGCFLHAAFKIFVGALSPQFPSHYLAQIISYLRIRLPLFLQSVHLEVQERATIFQYLLAEFGILAVEDGIFHDATRKGGTHEESDSDSEENASGVENTVEDLLLFLPDESMSVQGTTMNSNDRASAGIAAAQHAHQSEVLSVQPTSADRAGAAIALKYAKSFKVLTSDEFYTVHPKAQKKVPLPSDMDLNKARRPDDLSQVLCHPEPSNPSIANLSFLGSKGNQTVLACRDGNGAEEVYSDESVWKENSLPSSGVVEGASKENDYYYIKNTGKMRDAEAQDKSDEELTSSNRREDYDDILVVGSEVRRRNRRETEGHKKKGKGRKSKDKSRAKVSAKGVVHVNRADLLPSGQGIISDDDDLDAPDGKPSQLRGKKKGKQKSSSFDEDNSDAGLEDIDITRPLRPEEVFPSYRHHEPSTTEHEDKQPPEEISSKKKSKKGKKEKKSSKSKKKSQKPDEQRDESGLLEFLHSDNPTKPSSNSKGKTSSKERVAKTEKSSAHPLWLPLCEQDLFEISYSSQYDADVGVIKLLFQVENSASNASPISASFQVLHLPAVLESTSLLKIPDSSAPSIALVDKLPPGHSASSQSEQTFHLALSSAEDVLSLLDSLERQEGISLKAFIELHQLLGAEKLPPLDVVLRPSICNFCVPRKLSIDQFSSLLSRSSKCCQAKVALSYSSEQYSKPKKLCKIIGKFLNSFEVESTGDGLASSFSSRIGPSKADHAISIFTLLKVSKKESSFSVDVKCVGHDASACERVLKLTLESLKSLAL